LRKNKMLEENKFSCLNCIPLGVTMTSGAWACMPISGILHFSQSYYYDCPFSGKRGCSSSKEKKC
jgi:hypothetical protein